MNAIVDALSRGVEQLLRRAGDPLHMRLITTPLVAIIFAIRAGLREAREGQAPFLWEFFTNPAQGQRLVRSQWKDIGRMVILAPRAGHRVASSKFCVRSFVVQALILIVVLAIGPYSIVRGITNRLTRGVSTTARRLARSVSGRIARKLLQ